MGQDTTLSYASPMPPFRGASLGNGVIGVAAGVSATFSGLLLVWLIQADGWGRLAVIYCGIVGTVVQGLFAGMLALLYFLCCRRLQRRWEIILVFAIWIAPVLTGLVLTLALALAAHG